MNPVQDDPLWPHFSALWAEVERSGSRLIVAGGYGLLLKMRHLIRSPAVPILVPLDQWRDAAPRATKDLDLIVGLDLIADRNANSGLKTALERQGFSVSNEENKLRWTFNKKISESHVVVVELHSAPPLPQMQNLDTDRTRVKHKPSLGDAGIHARKNPEALGCDRNFEFTQDRFFIRVPHPVTWSMMKLTAMRDRHKLSTVLDRTDQEFQRLQAQKHAKDACRAVAMATRDEMDQAASLIEGLKSETAFTSTTEIIDEYFKAKSDWGMANVATQWVENDLDRIKETLLNWFH